MKELRYSYTRRQVPSILRDECDLYIYYERLGKNREVCHAVVDNLVNTWRGDQNYEKWCRDVFSKAHTAETADEIPVKADPGPRKGKYADVEEFSFPNKADPEKPCHGATPCYGDSAQMSSSKERELNPQPPQHAGASMD